MCAIGRAFVARHPNWGYSPTCDEFREMTAIYIDAPSPLAAQLGFGNRVQSTTRRRTALTLDEWGFALTTVNQQEPPGYPRTHEYPITTPPLTYALHHDALKAGLEGRMEVRGLLTNLLPPKDAKLYRAARDGLVPDALLRRPTENDAVYKDHLHDLKTLHNPYVRHHLQRLQSKGEMRRNERGHPSRQSQHGVRLQGTQTR